MRAHRDEDFPVTIVRPSLTYDTHFPIAIGGWGCYTLADRLKRGKEIIVHGDGTSIWTVTHAEDFAKGFLGLMGHPQAIGQSFHITSDELPDATVMSEQLMLADHYSGSRLLALAAERRMCMVLAFGLLLLALGNLLAFAADFALKRLIVEALLVLGMIVFWRRSARLHERMVRQTCLGWLMRVLTCGASGSAS